MIRLIQRRLIVPRGDTGTFSIPILAGKDSGDTSVFTIFSPLTHRKIFEKVMTPKDGILTMDLTHGDTVNLPVGEYVWDIKFYSDASISDDGRVISGTEVDSYYAAFTLPICEIRETGDNLLMADNAPDSALAPSQINYVEAKITEIREYKESAETSAADANTSATNAESFASAALASEQAALDSQNAAEASSQAAIAAAESATASAAQAQEAAAQVEVDLAAKANIADLSEVAFSGDYSDLNGAPTNVSSFTNDAGYLTQHQDISGKADKTDTVLNTTLSHGRSDGMTVGADSVAYGAYVAASGAQSQALGNFVTATGAQAQAIGNGSVAHGSQSHAEGVWTIANHRAQHAAGEWNIADPSNAASTERGTYIEIIGNGTSGSARSNARTLDWSGNEELAGDLTVNKGTANEISISTIVNTIDTKYTKPQDGIPASDLATGVIPDISDKADKTDTVLNTTLSMGRNPNSTVGTRSVATGLSVSASGNNSHAEGSYTIASASSAHAEGAGTTASGDYSHAEGSSTVASGHSAHAEGGVTNATGPQSHAEGGGTFATGLSSHAEGGNTTANHRSQHAGGEWNVIDTSNASPYSRGTYIEIIGNGTADDARSNARTLDWGGNEELAGDLTVNKGTANEVSIGSLKTQVDGKYEKPASGIPASDLEETYLTSFTETDPTVPAWAKAAQKPIYTASEVGAPTVQEMNTAIGNAIGNINSFDIAVVQELPTQDISTHTIYLVPKTGETNDAYDEYVYINNAWEMIGNTQIDLSGKADKTDTVLNTTLSMGRKANTTVGFGSVATGDNVTASSYFSHAEGTGTTASNTAAHAEGGDSTASGMFTHAEGYGTTASETSAHAEGSGSSATSMGAHAEGGATTASGMMAHSEGSYTTASKTAAHAEGDRAVASATAAHAEGTYTIAAGNSSHVVGKYNIADSYDSWNEWTANTTYVVGDKVKRTTTSNGNTIVTGYICKTANSDSSFTSSKWTNQNGYTNYVEIVGNGMADNARSNARTLDWSGNEELAGDLTIFKGTQNEVSVSNLVQDIQINGTSIISNNVANIPIASSENAGVIKIATINGFSIYNGSLVSVSPNDATIKAGTNGALSLKPSDQHKSVFYGLAKAAGDTTQALSDNAVGTYTTNAKTAIQQMLDVPANANVPIEPGTGLSSAKLKNFTSIIGANTYTYSNTASGTASFAFGFNNTASGQAATAFGFGNTASGAGSITYGNNNNAANDYTIAEGQSTVASGSVAHAAGIATIAAGVASYVIGWGNVEDNYNNWEEWTSNKAYKVGDKVRVTTVANETTNVQGYICKTANSDSSFTNSHWKNQTGKMNHVLIVGNGSASSRSNAYALDWDGNGRYMGDIYVGANADSTGGTKVATVTEVAAKLDAAEAGLKVVRMI